MVDQDELTDDPFFRLPADSDWNACVGKQGTEENYLDGHIEAAMELVGLIGFFETRHRRNISSEMLDYQLSFLGF